MADYDYTNKEVRGMLRWELERESVDADIPLTEAAIDATIAAMTDEVLDMWQSAGLTSKADFQLRVERWRNRNQLQ